METCRLIPLASVVTPATLSVVSKISNEISQQQVPSIDFRNLNYMTNMPPGIQQTDGKPVQYSYVGPSRAVESIVEFVTANGELVRVQPPYTNASWIQEFNGPTLRCGSIDSPLQDAIKQNIARAVFEQKNECNSWSFLAWNPIANSANISLPFVKSGNASWALDIVSDDPTAFESQPRDPFQLFMVSMPDALTTWLTGSHTITEVCSNLLSPVATVDKIADVIFSNLTMTQCRVLNATYETTFNYVNGAQDITTNIISIDETPLRSTHWVFGPAYSAVDGTKFAAPSCSVLNQGNGDEYGESNRCDFEEGLLSTLSYQAVAQALFDRIVGAVWAEQAGTVATFDTSVANTMLVNTPELNHLTKPIPGTEGRSAGSLQAAALATNGSMYDGLYKNLTESLSPLGPLMEKLFGYSVVSMISSSTLQ